MKNLKSKLFEKKYLELLPENETYRFIVDYIDNKTEDFLNNSSIELAEKMFVSQPTLTRFAQAAGFISFRSLQIYIAKRTMVTDEGTRINVGSNLSMHEISENIFTYYTSSLQKTYESINEEEVKKYCNLLNETKNHIFFGIGQSGKVAGYLCENLNKIGLTSLPINNMHDFLNIVYGLMGPDTFVTVISRSFETAEVIKAREILENNNINYALWTQSTSIPKLNALSILNFTGLAQHIKTSASLGSKISVYFLADLIYFYLIFSSDPQLDKFYKINFERDFWNSQQREKYSKTSEKTVKIIKKGKKVSDLEDPFNKL